MEICKYLAVAVAIIVLYSSGSSGENDSLMTCVEKLVPCRPYLQKVNPPPPPACCAPLKEIVQKDTACLCAVFSNPDILKQFNITKDNALDLPKACGAKVDASLCAKNPSASPTASPTKGGASIPAVNFIGLGFVTAFVAIILL